MRFAVCTALSPGVRYAIKIEAGLPFTRLRTISRIDYSLGTFLPSRSCNRIAPWIRHTLPPWI